MPTPPNIYDHIARCGTRDQLIRSFLELPTWTPAMGALLVSGITPPAGCTTIPNGGISLDNQPLNMATVQFENARKILNQWNDWIEDEGCTMSHDSLTPYEFFIWCDQEEIDNDWLRLLRHLAGCPVDGYVASLPSPVEVLTSLAMPPAPKKPASDPHFSSQGEEQQPQFFADASKSNSVTTNLNSESSESQHLCVKRLGLPTPIIAAAFYGITKWDHEKWTRCLNETAWPRPARIKAGKQGSYAAMWDPIRLAKLAIAKRNATMSSLTQAFTKVKDLAPWQDEWRQYTNDDNWYSLTKTRS